MYGSFSEQTNSGFRTSGDNKEVRFDVPTTLAGASNVFTTPNISGTIDNLLGRVSIDQGANRLQNKDLSTDSILYVDSSDVTKKLQLDLSGFTTATTHSYVFPDLSDTIATETHVQSLSNKTLILPKILDSGADHNYVFAVSELAADRTITLPLLGASDSFVFQAHTQPLSNKTIDADLNTLSNIDNNEIKAAAGILVNKLEALTIDRALVSDGSGFMSPSAVTSTELGHVSGVTSSIQTQIDSKQADVITTRGDVVYGNSSNIADRLALGASGTVLTSDGTDIAWATPAGTGDVTAASTLSDNSIIKGDGGAKGIQQSAITIDDNETVSGAQAYHAFSENSASYTIATAQSMTHSFMQVKNATTITVDGKLGVIDSIVINGTGILEINGDCKVV
jgi:hypothetical protein